MRGVTIERTIIFDDVLVWLRLDNEKVGSEYFIPDLFFIYLIYFLGASERKITFSCDTNKRVNLLTSLLHFSFL